jgi:hypothetical protein
MRAKHRAQLCEMELGWRRRYTQQEAEYEVKRDYLAKLARGLVRMKACRTAPSSSELALQLVFPSDMFTTFMPFETDTIMKYYASELGHMLERELRAMNFATLAGHIAENERRQAVRQPSVWLEPQTL